MNLGFVNYITLGSKTFTYKELKVKHLKIIYKSTLGSVLDSKIVFGNLIPILSCLTETTPDTINKLDFISFFKLLFVIRCNSIGNLIFVELNDETNTRIEINIDKFIEILDSIKLQALLHAKIYDNLEYSLKLPSVQDLLYITDANNYDTIYNFFIKDIKIKNTIIDVAKLELPQKEKILESLPTKITSVIIKDIHNILTKFDNINLFAKTNGLQDKNLPFNFNINNLTNLVKILFGDQLLSLYENIFGLCKAGNFTPEYIENCTPGEYLLFVKKLEAMNQQMLEDEKTPEDYNSAYDES